jgi:16S rRNA (uracil1498-N3)-methyltransferase
LQCAGSSVSLCVSVKSEADFREKGQVDQMDRRFFVDRPILEGTAQLTGPEAEHLTKVLRGKTGDEVTLFDGCGAEFTARITRTGRSAVELVVLARHEICRELTTALTLGVALPKGDRQRWLIEKAVELGVTSLVPLLTQRGVAEPNPTALARLRRYVIEASKQCGRNRLLEIAAPLQFDEYCRQVDPAACRLLADVGADAIPLAQLPSFDASRGVWLAVGPEGGFTDEEVAAAAAWRRVSLGPRVLRIETAAVALVAFFSLRDR